MSSSLTSWKIAGLIATALIALAFPFAQWREAELRRMAASVEAELVTYVGRDKCLQCHRGDASNIKEHHFHQEFHEGKHSPGWLCVKCHMAERPYMVVDWRADHSIRNPRPDLSLEIGTPNACNQKGCHADQSTEWPVEAMQSGTGCAEDLTSALFSPRPGAAMQGRWTT